MLNRSSATLVLFTATACNTFLFEQSEDATDSTTIANSGVADSTNTTTSHPTSTSTHEGTGAGSSTSTTTDASTTDSDTTSSTGATTGSDATSTSAPGTGDTSTPEGAPPHQIVFVTGEKWRGYELGGLAGADARCENAANSANQPKLQGKTFRAWLSQGDDDGLPPDLSKDARDRLPHPDKQYVLLDGTIVASDWRDLTDGTLDSPINRTEHGDSVSDKVDVPVLVWTNTKTSGENNGFFDCIYWVGLDQGNVGDANKSDGSWTSSHDIDCNDEAHIYCIEIK